MPPVCKNAHDLLLSEDNKKQNTQLQNNFGEKIFAHA